MKKLLLSVTHRTQLKNGDLVLDPEFDQSGLGVRPNIKVTLKLPDGANRVADASIVLPLVNRHPYTPPGLVCILRQINKTDVPVDTQIWLDDDD